MRGSRGCSSRWGPWRWSRPRNSEGLDDASDWNQEEKAGFLASYRKRLVASYTVQNDSKIFLAFPGRFIIAVK
jgi:hypothetical protein